MLVYLRAMRIKGVTIECRGRGAVEVQPEGKSKREELTEGARFSGEGNEGVSKIVPPTQIHCLSRADIKRRQTWLEKNWRRELGANEKNNKPSVANFGHLIFFIHIRKPLDNL